jgi:hypothetical protein
MTTGFKTSGGEGGIRTLGTGVSPYNGLANRRIRPLCHLSGVRTYILPRLKLGLYRFSHTHSTACLTPTNVLRTQSLQASKNDVTVTISC